MVPRARTRRVTGLRGHHEYGERPLSRARVAILAALALALLALGMYRSYALGQYRTMYDNPIYRWRESVAVALSKLHDPPLSGYVAYRSIRDYLTAHGLALMPGEAEPLPSPAEREKLIYD